MTDEQVLMFAQAISQMMALDVFIGVTAAFLFQSMVKWFLKPRRDKELRSDDEAPSHTPE